MSAPAHLVGAFQDGQGVADAPVTRGIDAQALAAIDLDGVDGPLRAALGVGVEGHAEPETAILDLGDGVFLGVVDEHPGRVQAGLVADHVHDHAGALELVLQVGRVDQHQVVARRRHGQLPFQHRHLVLEFLFSPISPKPSTLGRSMNSGMMASTSSASFRFSDSLEFRPSQQ
jgi:hypothetical protein